jgi:hypothetical protein
MAGVIGSLVSEVLVSLEIASIALSMNSLIESVGVSVAAVAPKLTLQMVHVSMVKMSSSTRWPEAVISAVAPCGLLVKVWVCRVGVVATSCLLPIVEVLPSIAQLLVSWPKLVPWHHQLPLR